MGSQSNGPQTAGSQNWHKPCRGADPTVPYGGSPHAAAVMFCRGGEDRLAITREYKKTLVARYGDWLREADGIILLDYRDLDVPQTEVLRGQVRAAEGRYSVCKNTLLKLALGEQGWPVPADLLVGPTAVAFAGNSYPAVAKALLDFSKNIEQEDALVIKGGVLLGEQLDAARVRAISALPSQDELRAQLIGLVSAPAQNLVNVLNSATSSVVNVLAAYLQENEAA